MDTDPDYGWSHTEEDPDLPYVRRNSIPVSAERGHAEDMKKRNLRHAIEYEEYDLPEDEPRYYSDKTTPESKALFNDELEGLSFEQSRAKLSFIEKPEKRMSGRVTFSERTAGPAGKNRSIIYSFCLNCGKEIRRNDLTNCPVCGEPLTDSKTLNRT